MKFRVIALKPSFWPIAVRAFPLSSPLKIGEASARRRSALSSQAAFSALIAEQAGFEALYLSGASVAYTLLGRSDIGLTTASEV